MAPPKQGRKQAFGALRSLGSLRPGAAPMAIDFGVGSLKLLQLGGGDPPALVAAAELATPEDKLYDHAKRLRWQMEQLPKLVKKGSFKTTRAVCAIPTSTLFCKHLQFAPADGVSLKDQVEGAMPSQVGCGVDELLTRHFEVGESARGGKREVICFASGRAVVARLMYAIKSAKLEPVGIHNEFTALLAAFGHTLGEAGKDDQPTLYLDLGRGTTKILAARGGKMLFARAIQFGGLNLDETIVRQLKCSLSQARDQRLAMESIAPGDDAVFHAAPQPVETHDASGQGDECVAREPDQTEPGGQHAQSEHASPATATVSRVSRNIDLSEPVEILVDEVSMCLRYLRSTQPNERIQKLVFLGGESRHRPLCAEIARKLRLPAQAGDPVTRVARTGSEPCVGVDLTESQPGWAVAMGMCLSPTDL